MTGDQHVQIIITDGWIYYYHRQHNTMMSMISQNSVLILVQKVKKCQGIQSLLFKKVYHSKHDMYDIA